MHRARSVLVLFTAALSGIGLVPRSEADATENVDVAIAGAGMAGITAASDSFEEALWINSPLSITWDREMQAFPKRPKPVASTLADDSAQFAFDLRWDGANVMRGQVAKHFGLGALTREGLGLIAAYALAPMLGFLAASSFDISIAMPRKTAAAYQLSRRNVGHLWKGLNPFRVQVWPWGEGDTLEAVFGLPLEEVVRLHGRAVYTYGAFRFRVGSQGVDGTFSVPWLALTSETLERLVDLDVPARRLLTIENLVAFEEEVRSGLPEDTVAVWTGGFPSGLERTWMSRLIEGGIRRVDHWGDLDLGGLRIFRYLTEILPCPVSPWRMEPDLLNRLPTQPLTDRDREALVAWRADPDAPLQELAAGLLVAGVKAEQEGWWLRRDSDG